MYVRIWCIWIFRVMRIKKTSYLIFVKSVVQTKRNRQIMKRYKKMIIWYTSRTLTRIRDLQMSWMNIRNMIQLYRRRTYCNVQMMSVIQIRTKTWEVKFHMCDMIIRIWSMYICANYATLLGNRFIWNKSKYIYINKLKWNYLLLWYITKKSLNLNLSLNWKRWRINRRKGWCWSPKNQ